MGYRKKPGSKVTATNNDFWVHDVKSGNKIPASQSKIDHQGRLTHKSNFDSINPDEMPVRHSPIHKLPFARVPPTTPSLISDLDNKVWSEIFIIWSAWDIAWGEDNN